MKIGIDISQIIYKGTGVARFTQGLVDSILDFDCHNQWLFFFSSLRGRLDNSLKHKISNKGFKLIEYKIPPTLLSLLWNKLHIYNIEKAVGNLDWFITSDWTEPPSNGKKATIVHDLTYLRYPETVEDLIKNTQAKRLSWVKRESRVIFADSASTKEDLVKLLKMSSNKVIVNYPGVRINKSDNNNQVLKKFNLTKPFILTVGKIEPRKNLKRLIEAFVKIERSDINLVIAGHQGWDNSVNKLIKSAPPNNRILTIGYVDDDDLCSLYTACLFFVYPSIWEGFGYPVVEAMKLGAPVATSNTSSLSEIAGNAALLFNPFKVDEIKEALEKLIENENLRKELSIKGQQRASIFSWKNYYDKLIKTLL